MYPTLVHIHGSLNINGYGLMIALGLMVFIILTYKNPKRAQLVSSQLFLNVIFIGVLAAIIGGRVFFVIEEFNSFSDNWLEIFYPWVPGYGLLGSIIGILLVVPVYLYINKVKIMPFLDLISTYAPLLQSISRLGCFLAGCCYGCKAGDFLPWSVIFTNPEGFAPLNIQLHPTQLYSSLASFVIFLILLIMSKQKYKTGQIFFLYLFLEGIARFFVDFWRGERDLIKNIYFPSILLTYSQLVALGIIIFALMGFLYMTLCKKSLKE